ncbi:MAG: hypothetical protein RL065_2161, partial [Bacteroidota bacterium]
MSKSEFTNKSLLNNGVRIIKEKLFYIIVVVIAAFIFGWFYKGFQPIKYSAKSIFYPDKEATLSGSPLELINGTTTAKGGALTILAKVLNSHSMTVDIASRKVDPTMNKGYKILADWIIDDNNKLKMPWEKKVDLAKLSKSERISKAASILRSGCFAVLDESGF